MKIFQIGKTRFSAHSGGGSDRVFAALMQHLPDRNTSVDGLVIGRPPADEAGPPNVVGVGDLDDGLWTRCRAVRRHVQNVLTTRAVDVLGSHFALYTAPVLDLLDDIPLVVHFHGPWALESAAEDAPWWNVHAKKVLETFVYRKAKQFIVLSAAFRDVLTDTYGIPSDRISIVPGGVEVSRFDVDLSQHDARRHLQLPEDRPIVLSVRRLARRMGLENLIDAWVEVQARCPNALLLVAGKGPIYDELQLRIQRLGLESHVRLLGFVPDEDLPFLYRAADLSVVPTIALEGFGLTTVESLAAGTPVLVTPVGGLPEVVRPLSERLILQETSPAALTSGILTALLQPEQLPSALACRSFAETRYSWPSIAAKTRTVYEAVVKNAGNTRPQRTVQ